MCGIAGKAIFGRGAIEPHELEAMGEAINHRGPDDKGIYLSSDRKVGLSFRRLSIIDLSKAGNQPMSYAGRYQIIFNGEIYNYLQLRQQLEKLGYRFRSRTDTETILALYDRYGKSMLGKLRGMFAFAIYDEKKKTLFLARDRVGKKPLKYYFDSQVFLFASELKAILTQREYKRQVDETAIHHYLTYQYVPTPKTGFRGISKLEAAHWLEIDCKSGRLTKQRYWRLDYAKKLTLSPGEWQQQILAKLEEAVRLRLISDVPLGALLSGGIDSSAVVAMMSRHSKAPVKTFSIGFEEERFSELKYARMIAKRFKTKHTELIVKPDTIESLPLLVRQYEEPYADSSALPTYYVSKLTRQFVTVALNGDGGDENFAGYSRYSVQKFALAYENFRLLHRAVARPVTAAFYRVVRNTFAERASRFAETMSKDYARRYVNYICYFTNRAKERLYTERFRNLMEGQNSEDLLAARFTEAQTSDRMDQTLYADFVSYLPDDLLVKMDIATMAHSLEGRSPFLDHELLELTAKMPFDLKLKGRNQKKYILKQALRGILPEEVMFRSKMGFGVPIEAWFKGKLHGYAKKVLTSRKFTDRDLFRREAIEEILQQHQDTKINFANQIWALLTLALWFEEYFN